ncbi:MAG: hypothetical protein Q8R25_03825 [bacterium]|nr:hypothetical protein [bacterium]
MTEKWIIDESADLTRVQAVALAQKLADHIAKYWTEPPDAVRQAEYREIEKQIHALGFLYVKNIEFDPHTRTIFPIVAVYRPGNLE